MSDGGMDGAARCRALLGDPTLVRGGRIEPVWIEGGVAFIERSAPEAVAVCVERADGSIRWRRGAADFGGESLQALAAGPDGVLLAVAGSRRFALDPRDGAVRELTPEEAAAVASYEPQATRPGYPTALPSDRELPSPDARWFLTLKDHELWLRPREGGEGRRLTHDQCSDPRWSTGGARWSPDGRRVAVMRIDERVVNRVPLVDWTSAERKIEWHVYPRADGPIQVWKVFVIDLETGAVEGVGGGDDRHYAFIIGFSADGKRLRYARMERTSKYVEILEYDIAEGRSRILLEERSNSFLYWPPTFVLAGPPIHFLADGRFIWQSERTGWNHLYLYDADGLLVRPLSEGAFPVTNLVGIDEAAGAVIYRAQPDAARPYDVQIFRTSLQGGSAMQLSVGPGVREAAPAPDGGAYIETCSSPDRPPRAELRSAEGQRIAVLSTADASGLAALGWIAPEPFTAGATEGATELHGLIYKPADFDPTRCYPVIEYIYAGAQTLFTPHAFAPGVGSAFAQLGYIVVILDGRGTPGRGKAFQDVVVGRLGDFEIADHAGAIRQAAASRPWMDLSRVGVFGGSYGGYFTIRALIQAADLYRSGVAMAPAELGPG
ncbi:MAG TPA: DPP IV N-terminal domain-containing protein, partial [Caulobacteraceae bacterium]|nr:DPP IV N-terminal domain-containing protein [Caulobacteraceae bacterium]